MDSNIFEKYAFERLQMLERENDILKEQLGITDLKTRNNTIKLVLGEVYNVDLYEWEVNESNFLDYEKAVKMSDFEWLKGHGFKVIKSEFNILIVISDKTFYLKYSNNELTVVEGFLNVEFAEEELLRRTKQLISKYKKEGESA